MIHSLRVRVTLIPFERLSTLEWIEPKWYEYIELVKDTHPQVTSLSVKTTYSDFKRVFPHKGYTFEIVVSEGFQITTDFQSGLRRLFRESQDHQFVLRTFTR